MKHVAGQELQFFFALGELALQQIAKRENSDEGLAGNHRQMAAMRRLHLPEARFLVLGRVRNHQLPCHDFAPLTGAGIELFGDDLPDHVALRDDSDEPLLLEDRYRPDIPLRHAPRRLKHRSEEHTSELQSLAYLV